MRKVARKITNGGAERNAPTLSRDPERARRKGGAGCALTPLE